ncbi:MAG: cytochrome c [Burkholderiaceae bacterium]
MLGLALCLGTCAFAQDAPTGDAARGHDKVAQCVGCHGLPEYKTAFPEVYRVPMIGGQNAQYLQSALHEYKKGERTHPSMRYIAGSLSDQDIADIAAYYSSVK